MEDIDSFWSFPESVVELKQKLEYKTYELEMTKNETNEEIRKSNEQIKKLLQLLQTAYKERDEAKFQLQKVQQIMAFNKPNNNNNAIDHFIPTTNSSAFLAPPFSPDSPLLLANFAVTKANSTITDSSSFSLETHTTNNHNNFSHPHSLVSSPAASSPDSSNNVFSTPPTLSPKPTPKKIDQESLIIANLAKGKALPPKGKLLQAVLESGPLLSTLMVAGSLPQWRNPPGVLTHHIPPVNLKGCGVVINQSPGGSKFCPSQPPQASNVSPQIIMPNNVTNSYVVKGVGNSELYNNSSGSFGICTSPMLDFGSGSSGSCLIGSRMMINPNVGFNCQIPKRQRII
ncbi:uncharacterized protein LOC110684121 [Chenopodium quinoa]|uniref:uncharacterized protein LOC110684121 n=1 Tax=Chenopodium quinoa TaxID=63459 RepID=UPI000B780958|nr:uncharacterized protein LOC110684121 [Chenopodium quinoa]